MTILVFDSGIGGLSVLREARILMPEHRFVYVADDASFPIGGWDFLRVGEMTIVFNVVGLEGRYLLLVSYGGLR